MIYKLKFELSKNINWNLNWTGKWIFEGPNTFDGYNAD